MPEDINNKLNQLKEQITALYNTLRGNSAALEQLYTKYLEQAGPFARQREKVTLPNIDRVTKFLQNVVQYNKQKSIRRSKMITHKEVEACFTGKDLTGETIDLKTCLQQMKLFTSSQTSITLTFEPTAEVQAKIAQISSKPTRRAPKSKPKMPARPIPLTTTFKKVYRQILDLQVKIEEFFMQLEPSEQVHKKDFYDITTQLFKEAETLPPAQAEKFLGKIASFETFIQSSHKLTAVEVKEAFVKNASGTYLLKEKAPHAPAPSPGSLVDKPAGSATEAFSQQARKDDADNPPNRPPPPPPRGSNRPGKK